MKAVFPSKLDPYKSTKEELTLTGEIKIAELKGIHDLIAADDGVVKASIHFQLQNMRRVVITGNLETTVILECQRTLEHFHYDIKTDFKLAIVEDDREMRNFPEDFEALVVDDRLISAIAILEEEIMLKLPMIPKKGLNDCDLPENNAYYGALNEEQDDLEHKQKSQFAVLAKIKEHKK